MNYTKEELENVVANSYNWYQVLIGLGITHSGRGTYLSIKNNVRKHDISTEHFGKKVSFRRIYKRSLAEYLVLDGPAIGSNALKLKLLKAGTFQNQCHVCHIKEWQNKEISIQLDHINGNSKDNRLENLRMLCPNCHSQTETFSKQPNPIKIENFCKCGKKILKTSLRCRECAHKDGIYLQPSKIEWPPLDQILTALEEMSFCNLGKILDVSDNSIRKHLKTNGYDYKTLKPFAQ